MSFTHNENSLDPRPRTLKSTRSALNNVTNTTVAQEAKTVNSGARSLGKALRTARSRLQNAKTAGSLIPQVRRENVGQEISSNSNSNNVNDTTCSNTASSVKSSNTSNLDTTSESTPSDLDKENVDPFVSKLPSIEEEQQLSQSQSLSSSNEALNYTENQTMLKDSDYSSVIQTEAHHNSLQQEQRQMQHHSTELLEPITDVSKKRPISTVVEQEEPKKFKVCAKGTEYEWEDLDAEDVNDPFMVSEYVTDIFEYLHKLEIMTLPNRHDLYKHSNIRQNRDILVNWMVKIHNKFGLLPETLYLSLNIMDRFLCKELVQLEKLQLVGTACLFIASKYEEVYSPSVKHFAYETDGACDEDEIREGEKFILKTLEFNLNYPNPMNFLRRISKADDYDIQSRTLAKYLLEISIVDFRFIGVLPSLCAATSMFLSRKMLGKGKWDGNLIHYSGGYTREELAPVCNMVMDYLVQPVVHDEFFKKYASRKFMKASVISRQWAKKVVAHGYDIMTLHETSE
ncbi:LANO_0F09912g1_1 [Lachancea nothofagi CBS 11611]|uniref:LANO_0F09912g1_1 n=1 Tax=Lachancea nothofagi CBS 11611 TaxID=1266666 RepID=A0A1G4KA49_9SACH|nr:LANO_0F09912g1_1 [Lachancea nothofagi CBS 11611]